MRSNAAFSSAALVLLGFSDGLIERCPKRAGIDHGQQIAFLDVLAFGEVQLLQRAIDARF